MSRETCRVNGSDRRPPSASSAPAAAVFRLAMLVVGAALAGCAGDGGSVAPGPGQDARLVLSASVGDEPIDRLAVTVTADDIPVPLVFNLDIADGVALGTLRLPPGSARTILVEAFDVAGTVTHDGSVTIDVQRGQNPPVRIALLPRAGDTPIEVTLAEVTLSVSPTAVTVPAGGTVALAAQLLDVDGQPVQGTVGWGSDNPAIATVDANGVVSGITPGTAHVVASHGVLAAIATVTVTGGGGLTGVEGVVSWLGNGPLEGITVFAGSESGQTDANGYYLIPGVAPGPVEVSTFAVPAFCAGVDVQQVTVTAGSLATANFSYQCTPGTNGVSNNETDLAAEADFCSTHTPVLTAPGFVYGRILEAGTTEAAGPSPNVRAELLVGFPGTDPRTDVDWFRFPADFNAQVGNEDEYRFGLAFAGVTLSYAFRFSLDGGATWTFCDTDGSGSGAGLTFDPLLTGTSDIP